LGKYAHRIRKFSVLLLQLTSTHIFLYVTINNTMIILMVYDIALFSPQMW